MRKPGSTSRRVTQHDLAAEAGVSQITVSRALKNRKPVAPEVRERVEAAALKLGYRYHSFAASMRSGQTGAFGLLTSSEEALNLMPPQQIWAFHDACRARGKRLVLTRIPDRQLASGRDLPELMREWAVDGVVINYQHEPSPKLIRDIRTLALPVVWMNNRLPEAVRPAFDEALVELARHAFQEGHRKLALIATDSPNLSDPIPALLSSWAESVKVQVEEIILRRDDRDLVTQAVERLSAKNFRSTAIIARNRWTALAAYSAARILGQQFPEDLSLLMTGPSVFESLGLHLTGMVLPYRELAETAVERLLEIQDGGRKKKLAPIPYEFVPGSSLGPAPR